jgi:hypothetical protein
MREREYHGDEHSLHKYVVDLLRYAARSDVVYFHPPNGEWRSAGTGGRLKAMGVVAGVSDIVIVVGGRAKFLELKTAKGRQSAEQKAFADWARSAGAEYGLVRSPEEARARLEEWGALELSKLREWGALDERKLRG